VRRIFSRRRRAVMTCCARTRRYTGVVERRRLPRGRAMTAIASLCCRQMGCVLAGCGGAVVTRRAGSRCYAGVIERRGLPRGGAVTGIATLGCRQMRCILAAGGRAVVACRA
jgi:hypothetical protein